MSKSNDTSKPATLDDHSTLADSELDAVNGGIEALRGFHFKIEIDGISRGGF